MKHLAQSLALLILTPLHILLHLSITIFPFYVAYRILIALFG